MPLPKDRPRPTPPELVGSRTADEPEATDNPAGTSRIGPPADGRPGSWPVGPIDYMRLLEHPEEISEFGRMPATPSLAWAQEKLPVEKLSEQIQRLLGLLAQAHPYLTTRKHSLLSRVTGSALVKRLDHHLAVQELPEVLQQSEAAAQRVRELWAHAKAVLEETSGQEAELKALLDGAQAWLRDHPEAGESDSALSASPRERLLKRLTNLHALVLSLGIHRQQHQLVQDQILGVLDRYHQVRDVLLPVWKQQTASFQSKPGSVTARHYQAFRQALSKFH